MAYCQVCGNHGVEIYSGEAEVCSECWRIYQQVRRRIVDTAFCKGCSTWQKKVFEGDTPQCKQCC